MNVKQVLEIFVEHGIVAADQVDDIAQEISQTGKSLPQKVKNAQAAYAANDIPTTCSILAAFISEVSAQSGKAFTVAQGNDLLDRARAIRTALGC